MMQCLTRFSASSVNTAIMAQAVRVSRRGATINPDFQVARVLKICRRVRIINLMSDLYFCMPLSSFVAYNCRYQPQPRTLGGVRY